MEQAGEFETDARLRELVHGAAAGNERCWTLLIQRFGRVVWSVIRQFDVTPSDGAEIYQTAWAQLAENIGSINHPERLGAWLATTTRRECLRQIRQRDRVVYAADDQIDLRLTDAPSADTRLLEAELGHAVLEALKSLSDRQRQLISMLLHDPPISYVEISEELDIPIGSIGPTRARALSVLRRHMVDNGLAAGA